MQRIVDKLIIFTVTILLVTVSSASAQTFGQHIWTPGEPDSSEFAQEVLRLVNIERAKVGARPLELLDELTERANIRAGEIVQSFSHTRPNGSNCFSVLKGINYHTVGENIAAGQTSPEDVMDSWMNSQGHRENILNPSFKYLGLGYAYNEYSTYKNYWVQLFMG